MADTASATNGLLLIPVSGGPGSGELQRARLLARAARSCWPTLPIAIAAERLALAGGSDAHIESLPLPASPTRCSAEVVAAIQVRRPAVVVFDSTARPKQLRAARKCGAHVVYLSSRPSARSRGFRLGALRWIDEHWSVEFDPTQALPGRWQRWLLRWRPALRWRPLSTLFEAADPRLLANPVHAFIEGGAFALFCPGGGGGRIDGLPAGAAFARVAGDAGLRAVVVRADLAPDHCRQDGALLVLGPMANAALMALAGRSEMVVVGAGSLLMQVLALGKPSIALALAGDQRVRLAQLLAVQAVASGGTSVASLTVATRELWADAERRVALHQRAQALGLRNGLAEAMQALAALLPPSPPA